MHFTGTNSSPKSGHMHSICRDYSLPTALSSRAVVSY